MIPQAMMMLLLSTPALAQPMDVDHDEVEDTIDVCLGWDDRLDDDGDGVPDGCDVCPWGDDALDLDGDHIAEACDDDDDDGVSNDADRCAGSDDRNDRDHDGIPDGCDPLDAVGIVSEIWHVPDNAGKQIGPIPMSWPDGAVSCMPAVSWEDPDMGACAVTLNTRQRKGSTDFTLTVDGCDPSGHKVRISLLCLDAFALAKRGADLDRELTDAWVRQLGS